MSFAGWQRPFIPQTGKFAELACVVSDQRIFELTTKYTNKYSVEEIIHYQQASSFVLFVSFVVPSICILVPVSPGRVVQELNIRVTIIPILRAFPASLYVGTIAMRARVTFAGTRA